MSMLKNRGLLFDDEQAAVECLKYPIVDVAAMGFPKLWYNEPLWK